MSLINKVEQFNDDVDIAHQIVHGDATTTVPTEGGPVRSLAKLIADKDAEFVGGDVVQQAVAARNGSEAARDIAELARDAAFVNADVYPDVAAGLAAVADGEQFQVLSADGLEYIRYRRDGASAAEVARIKSPAGVNLDVERAIEFSLKPDSFRRLFRIFNPASPHADHRKSGALFDFRDSASMFQDAAGTIPVTGYGQPVGLVVDLSGNGNNLFQTIESARPTYELDEDGVPGLYFNGVDSRLDSNITDVLLQRTQLFVSSLSGSDSSREQMVLSSASASSSTNGLRHSYYPNSTSPFRFTVYKGGSAFADSTVVNVSTITKRTMLGMTWDGSTQPDRMHIYHDNKIVAKKQASGVIQTQSTSLRIGDAGSSAGFANPKLHGHLYGIMLFSELMPESEVLTFSEYMGMYNPSHGAVSGNFNGVLIAAADAPDALKEKADVVCTGVDDHIVIQQQLTSIAVGERVFLTEGQFNLGGTIAIPDGKGLIGAGKSKTFLKLQDEGKRSLSNFYWRSASGTRMQVIMHTEFVDEPGQRELYSTSNILLSGFTIVGNTDAALPNNGRLMGLLVTSCQDSVVSDVDVTDINWHEPAAIDPSKGFGIVTRYCNNVDIVRCSPTRAQYECLGMYDDSINTRFIDCYPGDAGRTSTQVHRGCRDSWIIRGHSKNTGYLRASDEPTKGLTVHGLEGAPIVNLRVVDHDVTCIGEGTGSAISWFGVQRGGSYSGKVYSENGEAADFSGNQPGYRMDVSGEFRSANNGSGYTLILRGSGIRTGRIFVNGENCSGINLWDARDIKVKDFEVACLGAGMVISSPEDVEVKQGAISSSAGAGIRCSSVAASGKLHLFDIDVSTTSGQCILFDGSLENREGTSIKEIRAERADGGEAVRLQHSGATFEGNTVKGIVALRDVTGVKARFNQWGGITYTGTTEEENIVKYNDII